MLKQAEVKGFKFHRCLYRYTYVSLLATFVHFVKAACYFQSDIKSSQCCMWHVIFS